ncbi:MAG TPA: M28 family peptidase [Ktedonobacteraceae bacterium]|nr:M28 family peptidase [Ktedonobacteraceae bacterium]
MRRPVFTACGVILLIISCFIPIMRPASAYTSNGNIQAQPAAPADFPTVDPNYIYDQLFYMATSFQHREAGYDNNLPVTINGHDEFAAYWSQEMQKDLVGFGPQVLRDEFKVDGWQGRPATVPAFNVEVSVPGVSHPEQVVVIGCHYDGEAISTQSANDDASGCAIELGVAKAMGDFWRSHHVYPARTLRFVLFDAEEQGLFGSFHYLNNTINGDVNNIVAMFNEEQNGIAYPLRYLGKMANPLLPFYVELSPLLNSQLYPHQDQLSQQQQQNITHFRGLMQQAVPAIFAQFQALGFQTISYQGNDNQGVTQPVFSADQTNNMHLEDDSLGGSDQIPFTLAGVPCATFAGNSTYYDRDPPAWSYPFDQKQDTIQLMNTFASGSSKKAQALVLALAIPGMLTTWMLNQPDILGQVSAGGAPIAAISDIGQTQVNQNISLNAQAAFDPGYTAAPLNYSWDFGDGSRALGVSVSHTYITTGTYKLTLIVSSASGTQHVYKTIQVVTKVTSYMNPYAQYPQNGVPPSNPAVILPTPNDVPLGQIPITGTANQTPTIAGMGQLIGTIVGLGLLLVVIAFLVMRMRKRKPEV